MWNPRHALHNPFCDSCYRRSRLQVVLFAYPVAAGQDSPLPAGAGKQAVEKVCNGCHEMDTVIMVIRRTKIGWEEMVSDMAARGATNGFR